jgi:prepilin-type N-terminal cleavage/methylation domain-containing protein
MSARDRTSGGLWKRAAAPKLLALSSQLLAKSATRLPVRSDLVLNPEPRTLNPSLAPAFTLTELLVVLAILALVATLAVPAMGPMFASNQTASVIGTLNAMLVTAQTTARANGTPVALRIEQAYKTDERGYLVDRSNTPTFLQDYGDGIDLNNFVPVPLDHQQIRMLVFAPGRPGSVVSQTFDTPLGGFQPVALPKDIWVAPGEYLSVTPGALLETVGALRYRPNQPPDLSVGGVEYNLFENFLIVFNAAGELVRHPADHCYVRDERQPYKITAAGTKYAPFVRTPSDSSLSLITYDRNKWNAIGVAGPNHGAARRDLLQRTAAPIYINRFIGGVVEEKR